MNEIFKALSANPVAITTLIASFGLIVVSTVLTFLIAFFQGREIHFWPPKIGPKADSPHNEVKGKKTSTSNKLPTSAKQCHSATEFFTEWEPESFKQRLSTAREICMFAISNYSLIGTIDHKLREFISRGGKLRIIYVNPSGSAMKMINVQSPAEEKESKVVRAQLMLSLKSVQEIAKIMPNKDSIQVKMIDHLPSAVITLVDSEYSDGIIYVTLNGFGQQYTKRPSFVLRKEQDGEWFEFYRESFESLWTSPDCKLFDLSQEVMVDTSIEERVENI